MAARFQQLLGGKARFPAAPGVPSFIANNNTLRAFYAQARNFAAQAEGAALWAVPGGIFAVWMVWPALTENFRAAVGLPRATPYLPSRAKYQLEEVDQMPVKKA